MIFSEHLILKKYLDNHHAYINNKYNAIYIIIALNYKKNKKKRPEIHYSPMKIRFGTGGPGKEYASHSCRKPGTVHIS